MIKTGACGFDHLDHLDHLGCFQALPQGEAESALILLIIWTTPESISVPSALRGAGKVRIVALSGPLTSRP
jgi:hypothetical protein